MAPPNPDAQSSAEAAQKPLLVVTDRDIVFNCPSCRGELVVDQDGAGLEVPCSHCERPLVVPSPHPAVAAKVALSAVSAPTVAAAPVSAVSLPPTPTPASPAPVVQASATPVPATTAQPPAPARTFDHDGMAPEQLAKRFGDLKHQLKENRSQDTEMRGHVNRATIELHRLQMRLKKLQDRQADIEAELQVLQTRLGPGAS